MKLSPSFGTNDAPTIDEIDMADTPSLVGYWKLGNGELTDYSGNGYDLNYLDSYAMAGEVSPRSEAQQLQTIESLWSEHSGYFSPGYGYGAFIDLANAPLLNTAANELIYGCELVYNDRTDGVFSTVAGDFDIGTYYFGSDGSSLYTNHYSPASGFNILAIGFANSLTNQDFGVRVSDGAVTSNGAGSIIDFYGGVFPNPDLANVPFAIIGGYEPSTRLLVGVKDANGGGGFKSATTTIPATAPAQKLDGITEYFGLRAQNIHPPRCGIKNVFVWSAAAFGNDIETTVRWLMANPGKIPPWLIGK